jgi:hypothetical protein
VQTEADKVYVNIYNAQASSVTDGMPVVWDVTSPDGVRTSQPATATLGLFVGLVDGTIAASAYGLCQAYGYKAVGLVTNDASVTISVGATLCPIAAVNALEVAAAGAYPTAGAVNSGWVFAAEAYDSGTTPAAASKKVFIRAL